MSVNEHGGPYEPFAATPIVDTMNRFLRPSTIGLLSLFGVFFVGALGAIMLYRYAVHGDLDWAGLASFGSMVVIPWLQWTAQRQDLKIRGIV